MRLPYGQQALQFELATDVAARVTVVEPPHLTRGPEIVDLFEHALAASNVIGPGLEQLANGAKRVTVVVSDATRVEPRLVMLDSLVARLPAGCELTLAVACGTHGPTALAALGLDAWIARHRVKLIVNHDGHSDDNLIELGITEAGTPVRLHRCVLDADLVIATGTIRPHYFAGFGAGVKAIFPGLGASRDIRKNHELKLHPRARAGVVDENPCRLDLEAAVRMVPTPTFLLNGIAAPDHEIHGAVAGDLWQAFRVGADRCRQWCRVTVEKRAPIVIASDVLPVTSSLYQACKIAAAVAHLVLPHGRLVIVAQCPDGTGPVDVVNRAIYETGIAPRLAPGVVVELVSSLSEDVVATTFAKYRRRVEDCFNADRVLVVPHASSLIVDIES
jgi:nickel-dependent lactate racemase